VKLRWIACALFVVAVGGGLSAQEGVPASDCGMCHDEAVLQFTGGPHARAMSLVSEETVEFACVACHGPGEAHLEDPSIENIVTSPGQEACLGCHVDGATKLELVAPAHNRHGVACLDCHDSGHGDTGADYLLQDPPRGLCEGCHQLEAGLFNLPFAHREGREPFECVTCHSLHGDERRGRLDLLSGSGLCKDCHFEKSRPFVYPHPPVDRPGCVACHTPHGSTNPRLLTRRDVRFLCLECHTDVPAYHDITQPRYTDCQNCHAAIHGSNRDRRLIEE